MALTARAVVGDREMYLCAGMNEYLSKPLNPERLLAAAFKWTGSATAPEPAGEAPACVSTHDHDVIALLDETVPGQLRSMMPEPKFQAIVQSYLDADYLGSQDSFETSDLQALEQMVHRCKGASFSMGASRLCAIAEELESACHNGNASAVPHLLAELRRAIKMTHVAERNFAETTLGADGHASRDPSVT